MKITRFEEFECWQCARELCKLFIDITQDKEFRKDFELAKQINASSGSAMDNISEGFGRRGNREFGQFLYISLGSSNETKSQLYRAYDKGYISELILERGLDLANETINKTAALATYLRKSEYKGEKFK